jgi:hypothetical protein
MSTKSKEQKPVTVSKPRLHKPSKFIVHKPVVILARHDFSRDESLALGQEFNQHFQKQRSLECEKKAISADFSSQIKQEDSHMERIGQRISAGFEMRETDCTVELDFKNRKKLYFRNDTGEYVKDETLSQSDLQEEFPFSVEKPKEQDVPPSPGKIVSVSAAFNQAESDRADEAKSLKARKEALNPEGSED